MSSLLQTYNLLMDFLNLSPNSTDTITCSNFSLLATPVLESLACCYDLPMTHIRKVTFRRLELTSYVIARRTMRPWLEADCWSPENPNNRTRWQDGEVTNRKWPGDGMSHADMDTVGHGRPRAIPNHHLVLLSWRPWHLRRLRCHRYGLIQQCQAMAARD